jgi:uncharacterized Zn-binding protein involved in type VI secretion
MATLVSCARPPSPAATVGVERASCGTSDPLCLVFLNQMSPEFETERLLIVLDKVVVFDRQGSLALRQSVYYSGPATAGTHSLQLLFRAKRGHFHFEAKSSHTFEVAADGPRPAHLVTIVYEKPAERLEERPAIRFIDPPPPPPAAHATTIWVSQNGEIELDGRPADIETVGRALEELSRRGGTIVYGVDPSQSPPHANAMRVLESIARTGLAVRLSVNRDFSDVVKTNGTLKEPAPE